MKVEVHSLNVSIRAVSRSVSCLTEIVSDFRQFHCMNRLGDGLLDLREMCLPLKDDLDSKISRSVRFDVLTSQYPRIVLLQSNSENFFTENVILDAFRLALSHVEIVIQCLLSKLLRKLSITVFFEALNMMLSTVNCATYCVQNFLFTMVFGCPCKPLRYSLDPNMSQSSNSNSTCYSPTSVSSSAHFSSIRP